MFEWEPVGSAGGGGGSLRRWVFVGGIAVIGRSFIPCYRDLTLEVPYRLLQAEYLKVKR